MNVVHLIGRIGKQPEIRYSQSGTAICNVSLATSKKINGEDKTEWHRLLAFGKTAELIEKHINKGDQLGIEGEIRYCQYESDGVTKYTTDIVVNRIHFIGGRSQGNQNQGQPQSQQQGYDQQSQPVPDEGDSIPF